MVTMGLSHTITRLPYPNQTQFESFILLINFDTGEGWGTVLEYLLGTDPNLTPLQPDPVSLGDTPRTFPYILPVGTSGLRPLARRHL